MSYILIPRINVRGGNAQSAYFVVSGPSPLAYLGFARKLMIDLTCDTVESAKISVAILHHDLEMMGEIGEFGDFLPSQFCGAAMTSEKNGKSDDYAQRSMSLSLQPVATCNFTASILINAGDLIDGISEEKISALVRNMRIAGGQIQNFGRVSIVDSMQELKIPNGFFIDDRRDLLIDVPAEEKISAMIKAIAAKSEVNLGWVSPMCVGYHPITEFTQRDGSRLGLKHAYAEPVVGLIQYVSKHEYFEGGEQILPIPFWKYQKVLDSFVVCC